MPLFVFAQLAAAGCDDIEPLDEVCPEIAPGELSVTEVYADEAEWIELYAARPMDLAGVVVTWTQLTGRNARHTIVRESTEVPQGYAVFGKDGFVFADVDFTQDIPQDMWKSAAVTVTACGTLIDQAIYRSLPLNASRQFNAAPSAADNDDESLWCNSESIIGSPGEENPPCL